MEEVNYSIIIDKLEFIINELTILKKEVNENESLILNLIKKNNDQTDYLYKTTIVDKSSKQQGKDFMFNVLANITADLIEMPKIIKPV